MKSLLLTRSLEDNYSIIKELKQKAIYFNYISSPLVEYEDLGLDDNILANYSNVIITSKYAAKILASWYIDEQYSDSYVNKKNIWLVGKSSKLLLSSKHFLIKYVAINVEELVKNLPHELYRQAIYLSSNEITQDFHAEIDRCVIYQVKYATKLQQIAEIKKGVDYILLYSQNSAKTLIELLRKNDLLKLLAGSTVIAISSKVANIIRSFTKNVIYCDHGKSEKMLELLIDNAKIRK
jgi:uroporphyrinogen-III synthase